MKLNLVSTLFLLLIFFSCSERELFIDPTPNLEIGTVNLKYQFNENLIYDSFSKMKLPVADSKFLISFDSCNQAFILSSDTYNFKTSQTIVEDCYDREFYISRITNHNSIQIEVLGYCYENLFDAEEIVISTEVWEIY